MAKVLLIDNLGGYVCTSINRTREKETRKDISNPREGTFIIKTKD